MAARRAVLVLGVHRSGTSAVTGALDRLGLDTGEASMPVNEGNPLGYYEHPEVVRLNDRLLATFGLRWHDPRPLPDGWLDRADVVAVRRQIAALLRRDFSAYPQWAIKDPRLCRLVPAYRAVLADLGIEAAFVIVVRHPAAVASSLQVRDEFDPGKSLLLWLRDQLEAERQTRGAPRVFVAFDRLLEDWRSELIPALQSLGLEVDVAAAPAVDEFLRAELRHHRPTTEIAHPWVARAFEAMQRLRMDAADQAACETLDEVYRGLTAATELFGAALGDLATRLESAYAALGRNQTDVDPQQWEQVLWERLHDECRVDQERQQREADDLRAALARASEARQSLQDDRDAAVRATDDLQQRLVVTEQRLAELSQTMQAIKRSLAWRATAPARYGLDALRAVRVGARKGAGLLSVARVRYAWQLVRAGRVREAAERALAVVRQELAAPPSRDRYEVYCELNRPTTRRRRWLAERVSRAGTLPTVSVLMPVFDPDPTLLRQAVASVLAQEHCELELVLCDDASRRSDTGGLLDELAASDSRVCIERRSANGGISRATNAAAAVAKGDVLVFVDQDDELAPDAVAEVALAFASGDDVDVVYSDDDKIDEANKRYAPQLKPEWSPELLLSFSYFSHLFALRRSLFDEVGGLRPELDGAQDHDLMLRVTERARRVVRVPKVLYHWRASPGSTAVSGTAKPRSIEAGRRAVEEAYRRRGAEVTVRQAAWAESIGCGVFEPRFPQHGRRVAIVVPTRNHGRLLKRCLSSVEQRTEYRDYEIVVIDNGSDEPETVRYLASLPYRVLRIENPRSGRFNFAAINNRAVEQLDHELVLFLNNDTEVRRGDWLGQMVGYLSLEGVGAVGARLLLADGRVQHAGILHGLYEGMAGPAFKLLPSWDGGHMGLALSARNCSAVTAACLLMRRDTFLELGEFDEKTFAVAYNDVDLCYRLRATGRRIVYCPSAELVHDEGGSGRGDDEPAEEAAFRERYRGFRDPYYSPGLSLEDERFQVRAGAVEDELHRPIRVLMAGFNLNAEGSSNSQLELTLGLCARGVIDPVVYSPDDGPLRQEYERRGIEVLVEPHPLRHVHDCEFLERRLTEFGARLREVGAEVVYGNTMQTFYAILAAECAGLPSVWNVRESEPWQRYYDYLAPELRPVALSAFEKAYAVVFVSGRTRERFADLDSRGTFRLIRNALDPRRSAERLDGQDRLQARTDLGVAADDVLLLSLGTVCERKGQLEAVQAFARMSETAVARSRLVIVGDRQSTYSRQVHDAIDGLPDGRRARVVVEPESADVGRFYAAADVLVFTSRFESYPRVLLEAMHCGLPIVSTPVFGVTEQVRDGVNARLYPPGRPDELAGHLDAMVLDAELRQRLAARSRDVLRALPNFEDMVGGYARVLREAWFTGDDR